MIIVKKTLIFTCLSLLIACGISHIKHLHSLSLYSYHVESTKMETLGAWHFPKKLPKGVNNLIYKFNFDRNCKKMELSYTTSALESYKAFSERLISGKYSSISSLSLNSETGKVTYLYQRWMNQNPPSQVPKQLAMVESYSN